MIYSLKKNCIHEKGDVMSNPLIALFGEAQKGSFNQLFHIKSLEELSDTFGEPTEDSVAINFAVRTLLSSQELIFLRVKEEGFSFKDYINGIQLLDVATSNLNLSAIFLPGIGDYQIIDATFKLCEKRGSIFISTPQDLYDYLTFRN